MKLSEATIALQKVVKDQNEANAEFTSAVADLQAQIDVLKQQNADPEVTNEEFNATLDQVVTGAKALADRIPGPIESPDRLNRQPIPAVEKPSARLHKGVGPFHVICRLTRSYFCPFLRTRPLASSAPLSG